jgi:hypothetical protein
VIIRQEYCGSGGVVESEGAGREPDIHLHHRRNIMRNSLLSVVPAGRRTLLLGKAGLLAAALVLAPSFTSSLPAGHSSLAGQAWASNEVPGADDPAGHDANDDNGVDAADHDANDDNGADNPDHDANDDGNAGASPNRGPSANSGPGNSNANSNSGSNSSAGNSNGGSSGGSGNGGSGNSGSGHGGGDGGDGGHGGGD